MAYPAIASMARLKPLQDSQILNVRAISEMTVGLPEHIQAKRPQWAGLCRLHYLKEWAIFGILVCPGKEKPFSFVFAPPYVTVRQSAGKILYAFVGISPRKCSPQLDK